MSAWYLVTGGVASNIGKGVAAAMLARRLARAHGPVDYRKLEPCLQTALDELPNTAFGEIVRAPDGHTYDADIARAAFWVPGFEPDSDSDLSLGRLLPSLPTREASPRLRERLAAALRERYPVAPHRVVELGGTAGEAEHALLLSALFAAFGVPTLHLHVTALVRLPDGRMSTKPAQLGVDALAFPPDHVFVRGMGGPEALRAHLGAIPVIAVPDEAWPERAWHRCMEQVLPASSPDPVLEAEGGASAPIDVVTDVGLEAYESLRTRLYAWTGGRAQIVRGGAPLRIGESAPRAVSGAFSIVPVEEGHDARDPRRRPDWQGTADAPAGPLAEWLRTVPQAGSQEPSRLTYAVPAFAEVYLEHSRSGQLRDHEALAPLLDRALPASLQGVRLLDVGCGDGRLSARFVARGASVVGVEPAEPMADGALARRLPRFELVRATASEFRVDGVFDVAVAWMSLDHCEDLAAALANIARVLRPGARLIACTEHAMRTAPADGVRWTADAGRVRDYCTSGWRTFHWFGRPEPVSVHHLPMGAWVEAASRAGLRLVHLAEPGDPADHGVPRFQLFVFDRPDPTNRLITLDGPAGCGKSTLGTELARALGGDAVHLDSGRLTRTLALRTLVGGTLGREVVGGEVVWSLDGRVPGAEALDSLEVVAGCSGVPDADVVAEVELMEGRLVVISGRSWGRWLTAGLRLWLDAPVETRAARQAMPQAELAGRDDRDRQRGRLLPPDLGALALDGCRPTNELVSHVLLALGAG